MQIHFSVLVVVVLELCFVIMASEGRSEKFLEYPFVSEAHKKVMVDVVSELENGLKDHLLPSSLPHDVQYYTNQSGSVQASFHVRSGQPESPIDFVWGSWVHYERPNGSSLDITSFTAYFNSSKDAPNFGIDLIRHSPTMFVAILDLFPRRDLTLYPQYLQKFYQDTHLDLHREAFEKVEGVKAYISPSLFMRTTVSPTAVMIRIDTEGNGGEARLEEILSNHLDPISKQVLNTWFEHCVNNNDESTDQTDREYLKKRDGVIRHKVLDIDLAPSFLELFGQHDGQRLLDALRSYFFAHL